MNIQNNSRFQFTEKCIELALEKLVKRKTIDNISVKDICKEAGINRSSYYAHYQDVNDLIIKTEYKLAHKFTQLALKNISFDENYILNVLNYIKENRHLYLNYFKTNNSSGLEKLITDNLKTPMNNFLFEYFGKHYQNNELTLHLKFFTGGLKNLIHYWLETDCKETPEYLVRIIKDEYKQELKWKQKRKAIPHSKNLPFLPTYICICI